MPGNASAARPMTRYQLIVLDAFSSDAVPVHLLSREAIRLYRAKLARGAYCFSTCRTATSTSTR